MKKIKLRKNLVLLIFLVFGIAILSYLLINALWVKKQESINISLDQIVSGLEDKGYTLENIEYVNNLDAGHFGMIKKGVFFTINNQNEKFEIMIEKMDSWENAKRGCEISLDTKQYAVFGFTFYYGDLLVNIYPPDSHFRNDLYKSIIEIADRVSN